ncbi:hypothetical protein [Vibrio phage PH669]|uniref:Uncharacterized protein n=1 Tax=Vibrio phage PH669 TaxID=2800823 RepID=A0A7T6ZMD1_9CAUD|nr:hypothetical protein [Vibrio phage PH669]
MKDLVKLCEDEVLFQLSQEEDKLMEEFIRAKRGEMKLDREVELEQMWQTQRAESEPMDATTRAMLLNGQFGKHGSIDNKFYDELAERNKIAIAHIEGSTESAVQAFRSLATAMEKCGHELAQFAYVVTTQARDNLVEQGYSPDMFIVSDSFPNISELLPRGGDVVIMGGRGGGKSGLVAELLKGSICPTHKVKAGKLGGRTSKGDRRRKRQQWNRPRGTN